MGTVKYENHYYPASTDESPQLFEIPPFGQVANFGSKEVDAQQIAEYVNSGREWPDNDVLELIVKEPEPVLELELPPPPPRPETITPAPESVVIDRGIV